MGSEQRAMSKYTVADSNRYKKTAAEIENNNLLTAEDKTSLLTELAGYGTKKTSSNDGDYNALILQEFEENRTKWREKANAMALGRQEQKNLGDEYYKTILQNPNQSLNKPNPQMAAFFGAVQNANAGITNK